MSYAIIKYNWHEIHLQFQLKKKLKLSVFWWFVVDVVILRQAINLEHKKM